MPRENRAFSDEKVVELVSTEFVCLFQNLNQDKELSQKLNVKKSGDIRVVDADQKDLAKIEGKKADKVLEELQDALKKFKEGRR